jgi:uncharacterized protein YutE (UPF0331/DUF86 family)
MDWLQFLSSILASLAWPAAVVICVLLLRRELIQVMRRLRRIKYGDAEAEFGERLEEVEEDIAQLPVPVSPEPEVVERQLEYKGLDRFSNSSQVFVSWLAVESAILNLARTAGLLQPNMPSYTAAELLLRNQLIDRSTFRAIQELRELRNIAVHPTDARAVTKEEANRFKKLADRVAAVIQDRGRMLGK